MALIATFEQRNPERVSVHGPVACGFYSFQSHGSTYLQLDTYGSDTRETPGKVSQTIQLDAERAAELVSIINRVFGDLG